MSFLGPLVAAALALAKPAPGAEPPPGFTGRCEPLPREFHEGLVGNGYREGCPVPLGELRLARITHRDFQGKVAEGQLVVHREICEEVVEIFRELFELGFPIEKMRPIHHYAGDDRKSAADNNTTAFHCRRSTGKPAEFSIHSFGLAIDVNPRQNPYLVNERVIPEEGRAFLDRQQARPGMIQRGDGAYRAFIGRGWRWGGDWKKTRDYQHFERQIRRITRKSDRGDLPGGASSPRSSP